jgi:PAS domain S-box-containing protein
MNLSIRTRLILIVTGITLGCLLVGFGLVGFRQVETFRAQRLQAMGVLADAIGDSAVSALAFQDAGDGNETLRGLAQFADIETAALYDHDGKLFATYQKKDRTPSDWPTTLPADAKPVREVGDRVTHVRKRVVHDGADYGTIEMIASNQALDREISSLIATLAFLVLILVVASIAAAWLLQRRITRPVLELADVARRITRSDATSLRAATGHDGEIGVLADGFNAMLEKLAARELEVIASRDTVRAVIDASPVAIIGCDGSSRVTLWNAQAAEIFGASEREAVGKQLTEVAPYEGVAAVWSRCSTEPLSALEVDVRDRALAFSTAPLAGGGAVLMVADITERRRAAEALAERAAQLQRAQKMDVVGRLAGGVAHDFNNLLTVVLASSQVLRKRAKGRADMIDFIDDIENASHRGAVLSRRLLGFSRFQAVDERVVDLQAVLVDLEKMVRSVVGEHAQVALDFGSRPLAARLDQGQLEQVLLNLVLNARDAMPGGGRLTLRTRVIDADDPTAPHKSPSEGWLTIAVEDTGSGMPPETLARAFEPFFTTKQNGTGLGLSTAHQIMRDLGGAITVESRVGVGTTFTLWLPQHGDVDPRSTPTAIQPHYAGSNVVLLVDDEPALRNVVQLVLAEAGYRVLVASSGKEALALAASQAAEIDLLLTDVVMPGMSGPQLAVELLRTWPEIQVLYMSGYVGDALTEQGLDEGATLLHKPFKPEQLLQMVREMLDARPRRRKPESA